MLFNSGTLLFLIILSGSLLLLVLFLILLVAIGKKNKESKAIKVLKGFVVTFAIICSFATVVTPLAYYNYIPVNLRFGKFISVNSSTYIEFHRDSVEFHQNGNSNGSHGFWLLENDELTITCGSEVKVYTVKSFGAHLYENGTLAYKYVSGD